MRKLSYLFLFFVYAVVRYLSFMPAKLKRLVLLNASPLMPPHNPTWKATKATIYFDNISVQMKIRYVFHVLVGTLYNVQCEK